MYFLWMSFVVHITTEGEKREEINLVSVPISTLVTRQQT